MNAKLKYFGAHLGYLPTEFLVSVGLGSQLVAAVEEARADLPPACLMLAPFMSLANFSEVTDPENFAYTVLACLELCMKDAPISNDTIALLGQSSQQLQAFANATIKGHRVNGWRSTVAQTVTDFEELIAAVRKENQKQYFQAVLNGEQGQGVAAAKLALNGTSTTVSAAKGGSFGIEDIQ